MVMKRANMAMFKRLAENGYPVDFAALDASFNLFISPITSIGVDNKLIIQLSQRVKEAVREAAFTFELDDIIIIPMVLSPEIPSVRDKITRKRSERAYKINRIIDYFRWQHAKSKERKEMLVNCVIDSIASIPTKDFSEKSKEALGAIVHKEIKLLR